MEHFYLVSSATARALKELYKPKAVAMLARGLRVPHYHLILIPVREGSFVDRLFSLMDAVQGFPPVPPEAVTERYQGLGLSLRAYRPSHEELEVDSGRLRELIAKELGRA